MANTNSFTKRIAIWLPPIVWAGTIFFLSSQSALPGLSVSSYEFLFKKSAHMTAYAVLFFLVRRAILQSNPTIKTDNWRAWLLPICICVLYAISDETHQLFTPNRTATFRDVGYDFIGMSIVFLRQYRYI